MTKTLAPVLAAAAVLGLAAPALAGAPQPARPAPLSFYSGRWYEIARFPNTNQRDCQAPTNNIAPAGGEGRYALIQTCHRGGPTGPAKVFKGSGRIVPGSDNAKMKVTFFGLISQEYWVLDHADDDAWAIFATPGGNFVWLWSRRPTMEPTERAAAVARIRALGYNTARLEFPVQAPPSA